MQIRALQAKAAAERDERQRKLLQTRQMLSETRRKAALQKKEETRKLEDLVQQGKAYVELEKRMQAEAGRKRSALLLLATTLPLSCNSAHF